MAITFGLKPDEFDLENIRRAFQAAEQHGFDGGWMSDHLHETIIRDDLSLAEAWTTLSFLSGQVEKLRLGISVLNINWRDPVLTAKMGANLDIISHGRFELVLGLGLRAEEYTRYGFPFGSSAERIEKCKEFAYVLENLWTTSPFSFDGNFYKLHNADVTPKPVQKPHPPLSVAAVGKRLIGALAAWNVGWYVQDLPDAESYVNMVKLMESSCRKNNVDPKQVTRGAKLQVMIAETEKELKETIRRSYEKSAFKLPKETQLAEYATHYVTGTPDKVRSVMEHFAELGATNIVVSFMDPEFRENDFHSLELFSKEVVHPMKNEQ
jgi:alkanesulfonate monooxygenase SsuD/methylene tetrahydromethanopterin reductase-like flavin-dependent oxidoreductase (luciferase family)